jgi:hypothetical protein
MMEKLPEIVNMSQNASFEVVSYCHWQLINMWHVWLNQLPITKDLKLATTTEICFSKFSSIKFKLLPNADDIYECLSFLCLHVLYSTPSGTDKTGK